MRSEAGADADESLCRTVHELAGGNPLLVREAAATVAAEGVGGAIPTLRPQTLGARRCCAGSSGCPSRPTALARAVAVLDRDASLAHAAALAGAGAGRRGAPRPTRSPPRAILAPGGPRRSRLRPPDRALGAVRGDPRGRALARARARRAAARRGGVPGGARRAAPARGRARRRRRTRCGCCAPPRRPSPTRAARRPRCAARSTSRRAPDERAGVLLALGQAEMRAYDPAPSST